MIYMYTTNFKALFLVDLSDNNFKKLVIYIYIFVIDIQVSDFLLGQVTDQIVLIKIIVRGTFYLKCFSLKCISRLTFYKSIVSHASNAVLYL